MAVFPVLQNLPHIHVQINAQEMQCFVETEMKISDLRSCQAGRDRAKECEM